MPSDHSPARWEQVQRLFHQASEIPSHYRPRFLDSVCADDGDLRREVESLLAAHSASGSFLDHPVACTEIEIPDLTGQRNGPWRSERDPRRGGLGIVYPAGRADG